jgi:hypothetical protein
MVLLIAGDGPLGDLIELGLQQAGCSVERHAPDEDGLFDVARGKRAVVYAPCARLLDGTLSPAPDVHRVRRALRAAYAPGVEVLVVVSPRGYEPEIDIVRRDGTPYVIVESPPLVEDLGSEVRGARALVVPRAARMGIAEARVLLEHVVDALHTKRPGRVSQVPAGALTPAAAFARAVESEHPRPRVIAMWAPLYRLMMWLAAFLRLRRHPAAQLTARLVLPSP